jgi:hypothetical protein
MPSMALQKDYVELDIIAWTYATAPKTTQATGNKHPTTPTPRQITSCTH